MSTVSLKQAVQLAFVAIGITASNAAISVPRAPIYATQMARSGVIPGAIEGDLPLSYRVLTGDNSITALLSGIAAQDITAVVVDGVEVTADSITIETTNGDTLITFTGVPATDSIGITTTFGAVVTLPVNTVTEPDNVDSTGVIEGELPLAYRVYRSGNAVSIALIGLDADQISSLVVDSVEFAVDSATIQSTNNGAVVAFADGQVNDSVGFVIVGGATVTVPVNFAPSSTLAIDATKASIAPPKITSVSHNSTFAGQPSSAPKNSSNITKGFYVADYLANGINDTVTISGSGFGTKQGTLTISDSQLLISVKTWSETRITARVMTAANSYTYNTGASVKIVTAAGASTSGGSVGIAGAVQTRPWGQCTWYVTQKLLGAGLTTPNAPYYTASIATSLVGWTPQVNDALVFGTSAHTAIIDSVTSSSVTKNGVVTTTYALGVSDYNAKWDEKYGTATLSFVQSKKQSSGAITVVSTPSRGGALTGYFRPK